MRISQSSVFIREARFHAYHGVFEQERRVGADFIVTLSVESSLALAVDHDAVDVTLNYASLYDIVRSEMQVPSDLLEHVAGRIARTIFSRFPQVLSADVTVTKLNPPMGADCQGAGVRIRFVNEQP